MKGTQDQNSIKASLLANMGKIVTIIEASGEKITGKVFGYFGGWNKYNSRQKVTEAQVNLLLEYGAETNGHYLPGEYMIELKNIIEVIEG